MSAPDEYATAKPVNARQRQLVKNSPHAPVVPVRDSKGGFSLTFVHLGRKYYQITLWASTYVSQRKWVENIQKQQDAMRERSMEQAKSQQAAMDEYVRETAGGSASEIAKAKELLDAGSITQEEYEALKRKALA